MRIFLEGVVLGIGYFTRLPMPWRVERVHEESYRTVALTLPFVGLLLGAMATGLFMLLSGYGDRTFTALLAAAGYLFSYGFLHTEGFVDIVDAWHGGHGGKDRHTILKDPHIGAIGALWGFGLAAVKIAAMVTLLSTMHAYGAVIAALFASRFAALWLLGRGRLHAASSFAQRMQSQLRGYDIWIVALVGAGVLWAAGTLWMAVVTGIAAVLLQRWLMRYFGFLNGDGLGFAIEVTETLLLAMAVYLV